MKKKPDKRVVSHAPKKVMPPRKQPAKPSSSAPLTEQQFKALLENNESIIALLNKKKELCYLSSSATLITGWTARDLQGTGIKKRIHPADWEYVGGLLKTALKQPGYPIPVIGRVLHKNGQTRWLEGSITNKCNDSRVAGIIINLHDITRRFEAEKKIAKALRLYYFLSQVNQMLFRAHDEQSLFQQACHIAVSIGQFRMAWVGIIDTKRDRLLPVYHAGEEQQYLSKIKAITVKAAAGSRGPSGSAIRLRQTVVCNDIATDPAMAPWRAAARKRGYASSIAVPIKKFGQVIGTFNLYAGERSFFDDEEVKLLEEATADLSYALENLDREDQRKKAEAAIAESEKRYQLLTAISPVGIFHTDPTGYTTYVNPHWCKITGMSFEKALGYGWLDAVHPDDRVRLQQHWQDATENAELSVSEYRFIRPDGKLVWVMGQAIPERDSNKNIISYVGTTTDITERKLAEEKIRDSAEKYRTLVDQASDSIMLMDNNGYILEVNRRSSQLLGYSAAELEQLHFKELINFENDSTPFRLQELRAGKIIIQKRKLFRKDRSLVDVEISARQLPDSRILCFIRDLTERITTEQQLELEKTLSDQIINSLPGIFYLSDTTPRLLRWNKAFETISGYSAAELSSMRPIKVFDPADHAALLSAMDKTYRTGAADVEARMLCKNGKRIPFYFTGARIEYEGAPAMVGTGIDITERVKAEAAIRQSEERYRTLIEQASDAIFIADTDGNFITINKAACEMSQYSEAELMKMKFHDFTLAEDLKKNPYHFEELRAGRSVTTERVIRRKDNSLVHVEVSAKMLSDKRLLIFVRDISERTKAQNAIFHEKNLSDSIINSLPGIFYLFTHEGKYLRWNKNFEKVTGYNARDIRKLHPLQLIGEEDREMITHKIAGVFTSGEESAQALLITKTGKKFRFILPALPLSTKAIYA